MGWCENTDTPNTVASAGANWQSAAGVSLFMPAEGLPAEPSCFLCPPPHIAPKPRDAGFGPFPGRELEPSAWSQAPQGVVCAGTCCQGAEDGDVVAELAAQGAGSCLGQTSEKKLTCIRAECVRSAPHRASVPRCSSHPILAHVPVPGGTRGSCPLIDAEACSCSLGPRPCLLTCKG